jgi:hypothetical protein
MQTEQNKCPDLFNFNMHPVLTYLPKVEKLHLHLAGME